jgi:hypothetical protein
VIRTAVFLLFPVFFAAAAAASEQKLAIEELAREADLIVKARVVDIKTVSRRVGGNLTTLVELAVEEAWKGSPPGPQVTVSIRGGAAGGVAEAVSGEPRFSANERTVVFLKSADGTYTVVGRRQGKFGVKTEADGHEVAQGLTGTQRAVDNFRAEVEAAGPKH